VDELVTLYVPRWDGATMGVPSFNGVGITEMKAKVPRSKAERLARLNRGWFIEGDGAAPQSGTYVEIKESLA
jgi:hypothetical protein